METASVMTSTIVLEFSTPAEFATVRVKFMSVDATTSPQVIVIVRVTNSTFLVSVEVTAPQIQTTMAFVMM